MTPSDYLDVVRERSEVFLAASRGRLEIEVPSCPGWDMARLVDHMGGVWGWASEIIVSGERADFRAAPEGLGTDELVAWAEHRARDLIDALRSADPESNCWTFGLPRTCAFWFRRQALETAVHTWDAQSAAGLPDDIDLELSRDGIDEYLTVMLPRRVDQQSGTWSGQSLRLRDSGGGRDWFLRIGPGSQVCVDDDGDEPDVVLEGPASHLYLWCLNRVRSEQLAVTGDESVAARWSSEMAF